MSSGIEKPIQVFLFDLFSLLVLLVVMAIVVAFILLLYGKIMKKTCVQIYVF